MTLSVFDYIKWHCKLFICSFLTLFPSLVGLTHAPLTPINTGNSTDPETITWLLRRGVKLTLLMLLLMWLLMLLMLLM